MRFRVQMLTQRFRLARPPTSLDPARLHPASVVDATANASSDIVLLSSKRGSTSTGADDLAAQLDATSVKTDTKLVKLKVDVDLTHEQGWDQLEDAVRDLVDVGETGKSSRPIVLCESNDKSQLGFAFEW